MRELPTFDISKIERMTSKEPEVSIRFSDSFGSLNFPLSHLPTLIADLKKAESVMIKKKKA